MDETFKKMLQKRVYDLLSHKYGIIMLVAGAFLLALSAFHFGQAWLEWSQEKYEAVFNSFSDNIAGKSFRDRLSSPLPIDVVYTWVNGTDPGLIQQLELVKMSLDKKGNLSRKQEAKKREEQCTYTNCLCVGIILYPPLSSNMALNDVMEADGIFRNVTDLKNMKEKIEGPTNMTLLILNNEAEVKQIVKMKAGGWYFQGTNHTLKPGFYTSEGSLPHGILVPDIVMMSGFPAQFGDGDIQQAVARRLNITDKASIMAKLYPEKGLALLQMIQSSHYELLIKGKNFTIESKELRLSPVKLVWDLKFVVTDDVVAASRFEDNEELRYSLRSIEQFAPWVRHIFIVTNGQIPYWLNLDNPRLTIITHDELFLNASHLPTFSSPAIEANIHRIPGLSDKFLYLNDDVMFGSPVWPDDFFSHSTGQKLYLTWPVPNCNEGCPSTWIRDGYCDRACNSSECDWDGGDCVAGSKGSVQLGAGFHGDHGRFLSDYVSYCATGCANNWLADKYCDQACNNLDCGYDIGDCGTDNYDQLYNLNLQLGQSHYVLPPGEMVGYFNLSELVGEKGKVKSANYETNSALRAVAVGNKFRIMTMVLNKGQNATNLSFYLVYTKHGNDTQQINLTVLVDTSVSKPNPNPVSIKNKTKEVDVNIDDHLDATAFQEVIISHRGPVTSVIKRTDLDKPLPEGIDPDILPIVSRVPMSDALRKELEYLHEANKDGDLTNFGVNVRLQELIKRFGQELEALKPKFNEQKKRFAEEEEQRKLNENQASSTVPVTTSLADDEHHKQQMNEQSPNNRLPRGVQPSLHPQIQVIQDFQNLGQQQQQQGSLYNRQKQLINQEILPQNGLYQADLPRKETSLEKPQAELKQDSIFPQINPARFHKSQPLQNSDDTAKSKNAKEPSEKTPKPKSSAELKLHRLHSGFIDPKRSAGDSQPQAGFNANEQDKSLLSVVGNDTASKETRTGRKLLAVVYWSDQLAKMEEKQDQARMKMKKDRLEAEMSDEDFLKLVSIDGAAEDMGGFPWEKKRGQEPEEVSRDKTRLENEYIVEGWQGRQLLDTFGDSLRHVNRIYNKEFGITSRKVPGHMPHMIDKNIMQELQDRFPKEWDTTSSHKIRSSTDMQYAFAYYYYLMGVTEEITVEQVFDMMDTDHSGVLSDREIRTLAARMYDLPLYLETLTGLEAIFVNCSQSVTDPTLQNLSDDKREVYYDKSMPLVTKYLFLHCEELVQVVKSKFRPVPKYKTTIVNDDDIAFKMVHTNVSHVVGQLDDIRKHPKKFICLNDNIDHRKDEAKTVKAILQDFYESLVPVPSQFELPRDYRNRFLHMDELREWRLYRDRLRFWTHVALAVLVILTILSFLGEKIDNLRRKWTNHKRRHRHKSSELDSPTSEVTSMSIPPEPPSPSRWQQNLIETV